MPPHNPVALAKYREKQRQKQHKKAKLNQTLMCDVPSCTNKRAWNWPICDFHRQRQKRYGHVEGRKLTERDLQPFLADARRLHKETWRTWPGWKAAKDTLEALLADPTRTGMVGPKQDYLWRALADRHRHLENLDQHWRRIALRQTLCRLVAVWALVRFGYREAPKTDLAITRQLGAQVLCSLRPKSGRKVASEGRSRELMGKIVRRYLGRFLESVVDELERRYKERQRQSLLRQADAKVS